jgi:hypothetical protein
MLSPDLLSLHPASGQPVPAASNAHTVRDVTGRDRVRAALVLVFQTGFLVFVGMMFARPFEDPKGGCGHA